MTTLANQYPISVIIVAKNEAHDITECIDSVKSWVKEIIVFDSGSTDGTPDLCRKLGAIVVETDWPGDGPQKNRALAIATQDWVICLDADERISPALREEIINTLPTSTHQAWSTPRLSSFYGKDIKHSGWWPDYITRIFRRGKASFTNVRTHTHLVIEGSTGRFSQPILHKAVDNLHEMLDKVNVYSSEGAKTLLEQHKPSSFGKALTSGLWAFIRTYFIRLGILDGKYGLVIAIYNAEQSYYKHLKAYLNNTQR